MSKNEKRSGAADRAEITDLLYRYAELIDDGDFDGVGALLARAAFGGPRTPTVTGAAAIAGLFTRTTRRFPAARVGRHRADPGTPRTRHLVLNPIVDVDGDAASACDAVEVGAGQETGVHVPHPALSLLPIGGQTDQRRAARSVQNRAPSPSRSPRS